MKIHMIANPNITLSDPIFVCDLRDLPPGLWKISDDTRKLISCEIKNNDTEVLDIEMWIRINFINYSFLWRAILQLVWKIQLIRGLVELNYDQ